MAGTVSNADVIAFRLNSHGLVERRDGDALSETAGRCGVQDSPPGSALLALHARVDGVTPEVLERAVSEDRSLIQTWCMRGAPFCFATADAPVFTTGVLPPTERARLHLVSGVEQALKTLGLGLDETVELSGAEIRGVLAGRRLDVNELGVELAGRIAAGLPPKRRRVWDGGSPYARGQTLGEAVVHFCLRILTLRGAVCFAPRSGNKAPFVLVDEWLGGSLPDTDPDTARAELLRRYLHCYGPSTRADFAAWLGVRAGDVEPWWRPVEDELSHVEFRGGAWMLSGDLDALRHSPMPKGVRLLPPRDPYTQLRDRETILDRRYHRQVWKPVGEPGTVLIDGRVAGIWRPRKSGRKLKLTVTTLDTHGERDKRSIHSEAEQVGRLRGAASVSVEFGTF